MQLNQRQKCHWCGGIQEHPGVQIPRIQCRGCLLEQTHIILNGEQLVVVTEKSENPGASLIRGVQLITTTVSL